MNDKPVTVANYDNQVKAAIARGLLEAEEISVFLADETMSRIDLGVAVGGVKVQVRAEDADRARAVLEAAATADPGFARLTEESGAAPEPDSELDAPPASDRVASRAMRGAILGLLVPPLTLYSIWLLTRLALAGESLSRLARRRVGTAIVCNILVIVYMTCFAWALQSWRQSTPDAEELRRAISRFESEHPPPLEAVPVYEYDDAIPTEQEGGPSTEQESAPSAEQGGDESPER